MKESEELKKIGYYTIGFVLLTFLSIIIIVSTKDGIIELFEKTGVVGDTFGGITAPAFALLGAYFIYRSFVAQINSNEMQHDSLKQDATERLFDFYQTSIYNIEKCIENLQYNEKNGQNAINHFAKKFVKNNKLYKNIFIDEIYYICKNLQIDLTRVENSNLEDESKKILNEKFCLLYFCKVSPNISKIIKHYNNDESIESDMFDEIEKIHIEITANIEKYQFKKNK